MNVPTLCSFKPPLYSWVASQLLSNHIPDEAVELIVVASCTRPSTLPTPGSRLSGGFIQVVSRLHCLKC